MKVRLGGQQVPLSTFELTLSQKILNGIERQSMYLSRPRLQKIADIAVRAGNEEALKIGDKMVELMDREMRTQQGAVQGLTYQDLISGARDFADFSPAGDLMQNMAILWPSLSQDYVRRKQREFASGLLSGRSGSTRRVRFPPERYFEYTGSLRNYFALHGESFVRNRLGGIRARVTPPDELKTRRIRKTKVDPELSYTRTGARLADGRNDPGFRRLLLGAVEVQIFPRVDSTLLPLLASQRWMDALESAGEFERSVLSTAGGAAMLAAQKLVNRNRPYRPLLLPVVQFWMQVRIPAAIFGAIRRYTNLRATYDKRISP